MAGDVNDDRKVDWAVVVDAGEVVLRDACTVLVTRPAAAAR